MLSKVGIALNMAERLSGCYHVVTRTRSLFSFRNFSSLEESFTKAKNALNSLKKSPSNEIKLKIYGLFKQSTEGECQKEKPSSFNFIEAAKWEAWNNLRSMRKEEAMRLYVSTVENLVNQEEMKLDNIAKNNKKVGTNDQEKEVTNVSSNVSVEGFEIFATPEGILNLTLNRPNKKNALSWEIYKSWTKVLEDANADPTVKLIVVQGKGEYFCSGNDLSNFTEATGSPQEMAMAGRDVLQSFVNSFINLEKPIVALVNGPAIGISVTTLALYNAVIASDQSTFHMPFSQLGQTPEGCSSYLFPRMMGFAKACDLVMFNKKIAANEAFDMGLVSRIIKHENFEAESSALVKEWCSLPPQTLAYSKNLIFKNERPHLLRVNEEECNRLMERWVSEECMNAIMSFFQRKKQ